MAETWWDRAKCRGMDPALFFLDRGDTFGQRAAVAVCAGCPVRAECLSYALENGEHWGCWGGKSEKQRRAIRLQRRVAA